MTRATGWNGRGWKGKETKERKILRYAQNDNSNAVSTKELHNFPYLCRTPPKNQNQAKPKFKPQNGPKVKNTLHPPKNEKTKTLKHI